jgi:hypothetical protein
LPTTEEALEKVQFYQLKRKLSDNSLLLIDTLSTKMDDVFAWYAVFSSDMAKKYSNIWKVKLRKNISKKFHYTWAKRVPIEMVKSEVLVKLNKLLNEINR